MAMNKDREIERMNYEAVKIIKDTLTKAIIEQARIENTSVAVVKAKILLTDSRMSEFIGDEKQ